MRDTEKHGRSGPSESRAIYLPPCPHYPHCVGCPLIDVPYPEQLVHKRATVLESFARYPSLMVTEVPPVAPASERLGYRTRVKLVVRRNRDRKSTRLNSSHVEISYAVFCLKKKKKMQKIITY